MSGPRAREASVDRRGCREVDLRSAAMSSPRRPTIRDAIAFGVMSTSREWNGDTWGQDDAADAKRLDALADQWLDQVNAGRTECSSGDGDGRCIDPKCPRHGVGER